MSDGYGPLRRVYEYGMRDAAGRVESIGFGADDVGLVTRVLDRIAVRLGGRAMVRRVVEGRNMVLEGGVLLNGMELPLKTGRPSKVTHEGPWTEVSQWAP
ncbi:MAG TPA: hypothetical protein VK453_25740 [Micromonosporaceae bacterium]|nr:hypothetical protein [Micromonosporaceae bacterium]